MPSKARGLASAVADGGKVDGGNVALNSITYAQCDWYSNNDGDIGALKLPRGNTDERPTVNVGGREKLVIDLTVSNPDIEHSDPAFNMHDPWIWTWAGNYNRASMTSETVNAGGSPTGLTLLRGSTYIFRNFTVGHSLWLKTQALSEAEYNNGDLDLYKLGTAEGVTNNGAKRTVGSTDPGVVTWTIPDDYPHDSVTIQHRQFGMNNTVPIATPAKETLGYIRLNTDGDHDPTTRTGVEVYTGAGWKTIPFEDNVQAVKDHPTGTLDRLDMGALTDSVTNTIDDGTITAADDATRDGQGIVLTAFLEAGKLSVNENAIVVHDGSTGGGFPMLRADQANVPDKLVNKRFSRYTTSSSGQTVTVTHLKSANQRITFESDLTGISGITLVDSAGFRCDKDVSGSLFKFDLNVWVGNDCEIIMFKNGVQTSNRNFYCRANYHNHVSDIVEMSFGDILDFRVYRSDSASVVINNLDRLIIEFVGS